MSKDHKHSPQHDEVLKKQALQQDEVMEVLTVIKKYGIPTLIVVVIICSVFLGEKYVKSSKAKKEISADLALTQAHVAADYQAILDKYGSTSSAPIAMMHLAMADFSAEKYDDAQALYEKFVKKFPSHEMAIQAELNRITCIEAKGQMSKAHQLYGEFIDKHKNSYLAPVAMMGEARCLEAQNKAADAKQAYEDLISFYPGSSWANLANTRLRVINSKLNQAK